MDDDKMASGEGDEELVARSYSAEQRHAMASRGTAMPDGSFPIADVEDLRNAIQAIGRAKDPDKAKAHIRKRARALGATNLIPESWSRSAALNAATGTHDGPGWVTHPRDTQRLRDYWTRGAGAAKIGWGAPGDFNRCRAQLGKYVHGAGYLAGTCANLHFVALGYWPNQGPHKGKHHHAAGEPEFYDTEEYDAVTAAFNAAAELDEELPPLAWFTDPGFTAATPLTIEGSHVYGHGALWGECHLGYGDSCVEAPRSERGYNHFRTGAVRTDGGLVSVGQITMDTGHADHGIGHQAAVAHYDNTGLAVADVAAGEDEFGVWLNGQLRPGISPDKARALQAATISGDWREIGGKLEWVAALAVNVPGFPIPRPELAASGERIFSLTAAGVVTIDPNALDVERIAVAVVDKLAEREARAAKLARVAALRSTVNAERVEALVAAIGVNR